jgi:polyisoprenoid-binding protein YceI
MKGRRVRRALLTQLAPLVGVILIVRLNAFAQNAATPSQQPAHQPREYHPGDIQVDRSRVYIYVDKTGLGHVHGVAGMFKEGRLAFDGAANPGSFEFDMNSFVADADYARKFLGLESDVSPASQREITETMLSEDVLNAKRFPTASFQASSITDSGQKSRQGAPLYRVDGKFTLHGVTRPLAFLAQTDVQGDWLHVRGNFSMLQSAYGIKPLTKAFGTIGVKDELKVWGDLWVATKATRE